MRLYLDGCVPCCVPVGMIDWAWVVADVVRWGLPLAGVVLGSVVAARWGWKIFVASCLIWGACGVAVFAVPVPGDLAVTDAVDISIFLYVIPMALSGALTLVIHRRRDGQRIAAK